MRRLFLCSFVTAFTIIGSIIGAGFITGKEVFEFFAKDLSLSGIYLAFLSFTGLIYFVMSNRNTQIKKWIEVFVAVSNIIVAGCMISALDSVYKRVFCLTEKVKILSIITAILLFIMTLNGISIVEKFCSLCLPIMISVIIVLCFVKTEDYSLPLSPKTFEGIAKPFIYVGFNVILSAGVIKNSGEKLSPPFKMLASLLTSFLICTLVWLISLVVKCSESNDEMPFISLFYSNVKLLKIIDILTLFAIYSTLISAIYTINKFGGISLSIKSKVCLLLLAITVSELGFSPIVEVLYPILGILAYAFIFVTFLLSRLFLKEQPKRTLPLQADIK